MRNGGEWTEARFNSFVKSALRAASRRWPPKYQTLNESFVATKKNASSGRNAKHYKCAGCNGDFPAKEVQVDHIDPIVDPEKGFESWDLMIERMFCEKEGLQVMCLSCHKNKTNAERRRAKECRDGK